MKLLCSLSIRKPFYFVLFCFCEVTILYENGLKRSFNGLMIGTYRLKHVIELGINPLPFYKEIS